MTPLFCVFNNARMRLLKLPICAHLSVVSGACGSISPTIHRQELEDLGRFEFRAPELARAGVVIGAPHEGSAPKLAMLARAVSDQTGEAAYFASLNRSCAVSPEMRSISI